MELSILVVSIGRNLFQLEYDNFEMLLSDSWIKALLEFASHHGITIVDRTHSYPQIERENDIRMLLGITELK